MAGHRPPGPLCSTKSKGIDQGTLCRWLSPLPDVIGKLEKEIERDAAYADKFLFGTAPAFTFSLSDKGQALLKEIEGGLRLKPYSDQTGDDITAWSGYATIGYGHLILATEWNTYKDGITASDADKLFAKNLALYEAAVRSGIKVNLKQNQFDALVIFAYNSGANGFAKTVVATLINNPKAVTGYKDLEAAWKASFVTSHGKPMAGLVNRRKCEWNVYSQGIYKMW